MVQILEENKPKSFLDRLGTGLGNLGQSASLEIPEYYEKQQQHQAIVDLIGKKGKEVANLRPDLQKIYLEKFANSPDFQHIKQTLIDNGVSEQDADLYTMLTVGGQTAFIKDLIEKKKRGMNIDDQLNNDQSSENGGFENIEDESINLPKEVTPIQTGKRKEVFDYLKGQDKGLTPAEKIVRGKERFDTGLKQYQEATTKLRNLTSDKQRLDILENLEDSKNLPKNFGRLNVDKEGNLKLPFLASREAQRFIKTLNEFGSSAKDTFGSRVTNFDLVQHFRKFPNLLNSAEGRRDVLKQMKIVNDINSVYYKNLKSVYDEAGGVRNIDADVAERFAEQRSEKKIDQLAEKFKTIGQFTSLPSPSEFKGKKIRETKTGQVLISNGEEWLPEDQNAL